MLNDTQTVPQYIMYLYTYCLQASRETVCQLRHVSLRRLYPARRNPFPNTSPRRWFRFLHAHHFCKGDVLSKEERLCEHFGTKALVRYTLR